VSGVRLEGGTRDRSDKHISTAVKVINSLGSAKLLPGFMCTLRTLHARVYALAKLWIVKINTYRHARLGDPAKLLLSFFPCPFMAVLITASRAGERFHVALLYGPPIVRTCGENGILR